VDHGRNLAFLSFYLISFYLVLNLNQPQFIRQVNVIYKNILIKNLINIFIFFFIFMWKLDQFAGFELQGKPNGIFKSSLFAEFIKLIKFLYIYVDMHIIDLPEIRL
jgi:cytosine/uracil/thiamine/allantoin permease